MFCRGGEFDQNFNDRFYFKSFDGAMREKEQIR